MAKDRNATLMFIGLLFVIAVSLFNGFAYMFQAGVNHVVRDFTAELDVHVYLFGWLLFLYGLYRYSRERWF